MNPEPTDINDLAAIARTTKSARYRRALASAVDEIETLRTRVKELEGIIDTFRHKSTDPEAQ
jgi:ppGpp synthetase/RelA/SpoT-type nucleotidyltranferase